MFTNNPELTISLISLIPFIAGFVVVTKKCFLEKYSALNVAAAVLLSPSLAAAMCFTGIYYLVSDTINLWNTIVYCGLLILCAAVQLPLYIRLVKPKNVSVAVFVYLCFLMFSVYDDLLESEMDTINAWSYTIRMMIFAAAAVLMYVFVIRPISEFSRIKQKTGMAVFVVIPAIACAIKFSLIMLRSASDQSLIRASGIKELTAFRENFELFKDHYNSFIDIRNKAMLINDIASYSIMIIFIITFAVMVRNVKHINEISRQNAEIKAARDDIKALSVEVMEALAHTIDAKDKYTNGHSVRVAKYSRMIAEKMELPPDVCESIYYMGLLHDIGKIGVPNEIINKPSRLTDSEYDVIKTHPSIGYDILSEIKSRPALADGARWHHERYDGRGYPDKRSGGEIPIESRIIAVADSYDAMTSNRSYRSYMPQEKVRSEIENGKGSQFDPQAAEVMIRIIDEDTEYVLHE